MTTRRRTARRPGAIGLARAARRTTAWDDQLILSTALSDGVTGSVILAENVGDSEHRGCTIVRMLIGMQFMPINPGGINGQMAVTIGIGLASDDAFSAGALPDPEVDADFPVAGWMYRDRFVVGNLTPGAGPYLVLRVEKDLRAQRKLDRSTPFMSVRPDLVNGSAFSIIESGIIRILYKLP